MLARLFSFVVWALVAATAVFWGLRLLSQAPAAPPNAIVAGDASASRGDLTRLLGAAPVEAQAAQAAAPELSARFKLLGIMAPKAGVVGSAGHGVALIAVDGKLPRAYVVGSPLDGELMLQAVSLRTADIGNGKGAAALRLELPVLPLAATGTLPGATAQAVPLVQPVPGRVPASYSPPPQAATPVMTPQVMPAPVALPETVPPVLPAQGIPSPPGRTPNSTTE